MDYKKNYVKLTTLTLFLLPAFAFGCGGSVLMDKEFFGIVIFNFFFVFLPVVLYLLLIYFSATYLISLRKSAKNKMVGSQMTFRRFIVYTVIVLFIQLVILTAQSLLTSSFCLSPSDEILVQPLLY